MNYCYDYKRDLFIVDNSTTEWDMDRQDVQGVMLHQTGASARDAAKAWGELYKTTGRYSAPVTLPKSKTSDQKYLKNKGGKTMPYISKIKNVIIAPPYTTIIWEDNTKTQVKCMDGDDFNPEHGFAMAVLKKLYETKEKPNAYSRFVKKWVKVGIENGKKQLQKKAKKEDKKDAE